MVGWRWRACLAAVSVVAALGSGGCEGSDGAPANPASGSDVTVPAADVDVAGPVADPLVCTLTDWGYGPVWDGTVESPIEGPEPEALLGITAAHNAVRRHVGVPELAWSADLAADAQAWADHLAADLHCGLQHDLTSGQGENLAAGAGTGVFRLDARHVVGGWACEREDWDDEALTCQGTPGFGEFPRSCGHYTQVAWRSTAEVGCGIATCPGVPFTSQVLACRYSPPGNFRGSGPTR